MDHHVGLGAVHPLVFHAIALGWQESEVSMYILNAVQTHGTYPVFSRGFSVYQPVSYAHVQVRAK